MVHRCSTNPTRGNGGVGADQTTAREGHAVQPGIPRYLVAAFLARLADDGSRVLLLLLAIDRLESAAIGGVLVACFLLPHVLAAPTTGVLADRAQNRSRFQAIALLGFGASLAAIGTLSGQVPLVVVVLIALAGGCLGPLVTGGMTSLLGLMAPPGARDRLYGLDVLTYNAAGIVGPPGAALLADLMTPAWATVVLGTSAMLGAVLTMSLSLPVRNDAGRPPLSLASLVSVDAVHHMVANRSLRAATIGSSIGAAGFAALPLATVLLAEAADRPTRTSLLLGAVAIGGLLGSMMYAWRPIGSSHPTRTAAASLLGIAASLVGSLAFLDHDVALVCLFALTGCWTGPLASSVFVVRDHESPDHLQTQVFTLGAGLKMSCAALGSFAAGLAASVGAAGLIAAIVAMHVVAAGLTWLVAPTKRH
jgi:MFS family permease